MSKILNLPFIILIRCYQLMISPLLGPRCRFYPSCSQYAEESIRQHGVIIGCYFSFRRLLRCHPWCEGGCDPVPQLFTNKLSSKMREK